MTDKSKMSIVGVMASAIYFCLIIVGFVLSATLGIQDHSVFKPLPYALGNTYDAETLQLAERYQSTKDNSHQVAEAALDGRVSAN